MNYFKRDNSNHYLKDTNIENLFICEYMPHAEGEYLKIYLFALMYADSDENMTNEMIAKYLGIDTVDVLKAWNYWEKEGVIVKHYSSPKNEFEFKVEFVSLKQKLLMRTSPGKKDGAKNSLSSAEISLTNDEIKNMYAKIEKIVGRGLEAKELTDIISWVGDYQMDAEVIVSAYEYCTVRKSNNKYKYVAGMIKTLRDNEVKNVSDMEKHLEESDQRHYRHKRVLKAMGLQYRYPTEEEKRLIDSWFDQMNFSIDTILEACNKTSGISNPNINYVNTILKAWNQEKLNPGSSKKDNEKQPNIKGKISEQTKEYERIRQKNKDLLDQRRKEVFGKAPRIEKIEKEIMQLGISVSKLMLSKGDGSKVTIEKNRKEMDTLSKEKAYLLTENGYYMDHLDTIYDCVLCKDTGVLDNGQRCGCHKDKMKRG